MVNVVMLQIERLSEDDKMEFRVPSTREMLLILQRIADLGTRVALYYDDHPDFVPTTLLGVNKNGVWLDIGPFPPENQRLLLSRKITFVSVHQNVKVQFEMGGIEGVQLEGGEAFFMALPEHLLRIQRRAHFRLSLPATTPVKCIIPLRPLKPSTPPVMRAITALDISGGGVGLLCGEHETELVPGKTFEDCQISLPDTGILTVTLDVKNNVNLVARNEVFKKRAGCQFMRLDNRMNILLQQYITRLERESMVSR